MQSVQILRKTVSRAPWHSFRMKPVRQKLCHGTRGTVFAWKCTLCNRRGSLVEKRLSFESRDPGTAQTQSSDPEDRITVQDILNAQELTKIKDLFASQEVIKQKYVSYKAQIYNTVLQNFALWSNIFAFFHCAIFC